MLHTAVRMAVQDVELIEDVPLQRLAFHLPDNLDKTGFKVDVLRTSSIGGALSDAVTRSISCDARRSLSSVFMLLPSIRAGCDRDVPDRGGDVS